MNRSSRIALIAAVLAVSYPAIAWLFGLSVAHQWEARERQAIAETPTIAVVKRDYHRGIYTSTQETTYRLRGILKRWVSTDAEFTVRTTFHHGPFPQLRSVAPATADTELILPPQLQKALDAVFAGKPALTAHTRVKWAGGSVTNIHSPAFSSRQVSHLTVSSGGLDGHIETGSEIGDTTTVLALPSLRLSGARGSLSLAGVKLESRTKPYLPQLAVGDFNTTVDSVTLESDKSGKAAARHVSLSGHTLAHGEFVDVDVKIAADSLEALRNSATALVYEIRFEHLHGPSLIAFNQAMRAAQSGGKPDPVKVQAAFRTDGYGILVHEPVIEVPSFGFETPDGGAQLTIKAAAPGLTRAELEGAPAALRMALVKHAQVNADLRIDTGLLDKLIDSSGKADALTAQLQGLQRQGYLALEGQALAAHLSYRDGRLRVNDLPFPPRPPAPAR